MRILICCNAYPPNFVGGAELVAHYQGLALAGLGHEVRIFAGDRGAECSRHSLNVDNYDGLTVYRAALRPEDYNSNRVNFSHPLLEEHFQRLLAEYQPQLVHFHNLIGLSVGIVRLAKEFGAATVLTLHDHWGFCLRNTLMKVEGVTCQDYTACSECQPTVIDASGQHVPIRLRQDYFHLLMEDIDTFILPSRYLAEAYLRAGFSEAKMRVIWNGIDVARYTSLERLPSTGMVRFTFIGTFGRHKGVHVLLAALPLLRNRDGIMVNLVGEGGQLTEYQRQLRESGCESLVNFRGKLDNRQVAEIFRDTDVFVLPSIWPENQPVSITEAMASGVAVVASNIGGIPELVQHGVTGFLFEAGNPQDLARKMDELIASPDTIVSFGRAGREKMRTNTFSGQARRLLDQYEEIAARPNHIPAVSTIPLIVCIGTGENDLVHEALELLPLYHQGVMPQVTRADWLSDSQIRASMLLWAIGVTDQRAALALAEKFSVPIVAPTNCELIAAQCRLRNSGLYYADAHEAAACIAYLLTHEVERKALATNAASGWQTGGPPVVAVGDGGGTVYQEFK